MPWLSLRRCKLATAVRERVAAAGCEYRPGDRRKVAVACPYLDTMPEHLDWELACGLRGG